MKITIDETLVKMQYTATAKRGQNREDMTGVCLRGTNAYATNGHFAIVQRNRDDIGEKAVVIRITLYGPRKFRVGETATLYVDDDLPKWPFWTKLAVLTDRDRPILVEVVSASEFPDVEHVIPKKEDLKPIACFSPDLLHQISDVIWHQRALMLSQKPSDNRLDPILVQSDASHERDVFAVLMPCREP